MLFQHENLNHKADDEYENAQEDTFLPNRADNAAQDKPPDPLPITIISKFCDASLLVAALPLG